MKKAVPGAVLDEFSAEMNDVAARDNDLQAAHVVPDRAVFDGPASAGIGGDEPPYHGALVSGVGRKIKPGLLDGRGEFRQGGAGLDDRHLVPGVDLQDPVHPFHRKDDSTEHRNAPSAKARSTAARRDRDAPRAGQLQDLRDFPRCRGLDHDLGGGGDVAQ